MFTRIKSYYCGKVTISWEKTGNITRKRIIFYEDKVLGLWKKIKVSKHHSHDIMRKGTFYENKVIQLQENMSKDYENEVIWLQILKFTMIKLYKYEETILSFYEI